MAKTFAEMTNVETSTVLVVDALNLAFRWKHAGRTDFRFDYLKTVESLATSYNCGTIILCADWGSSTYRKGLYPEYKADRKERFKDQTEAEKIAFEEFFEEFEASLDLAAEQYTVLRYKGVEADDLAGLIVKNKNQYGFDTIWLVSSDRDWDLLINDSVNRFSYVTRKEVTLGNWNTHYDVTQENYISYKCLVGDKGDNINGIKGIGPKRAVSLIEQYGDVFDIHDAIPIDSRYKFIQELNENADQLLLNVELMDLLTYCEEAIGLENVKDMNSRLRGII
jgi:DNA polymerase-1